MPMGWHRICLLRCSRTPAAPKCECCAPHPPGRPDGGGVWRARPSRVERPPWVRRGRDTGSKGGGAEIAGALGERGRTRGGALGAVGRTSIELRCLTLPPVPPEELPDSVRLQAVRQFSTLGEDWPLDFVPLDANKDGGTNVLAAAISPELVKQTQETCAAANLTFSRLVLRTFAAAALVKNRAAAGKCRLRMDVQGDAGGGASRPVWGGGAVRPVSVTAGGRL